MSCALVGQDIRSAFTGPLVLWFLVLEIKACYLARINVYVHGQCLYRQSHIKLY